MHGLGSAKIFTHNSGFSVAFRQWKAESHCRFLHGYALQIELQFIEINGLNKENWVFDFGGLEEVKVWLDDRFNHKTIIARDDPFLNNFVELDSHEVIDIVIVDQVGCEAFAWHIAEWVQTWLQQHPDNTDSRIALNLVKVWEHESNYAFWSRELKQTQTPTSWG